MLPSQYSAFLFASLSTIWSSPVTTILENNLLGTSTIVMPVTEPGLFHSSSDLLANDKVKRQPPDQIRGISAVTFVTCPTAGSFHREFQWKVIFRQEHQTLDMDGILHIDKIEEFKWDPIPDFSAILKHSFCALDAHKICHFDFRAKTIGSRSPDSLILSILIGSTVADENPKWEEYCVAITGPQPGTCPVVQRTLPCDITNIVVTILKDP